MSYMSTSRSTTANWAIYGTKWFLGHLAVYVAVAALSAALFFAGAAVYAYLWPAAVHPGEPPVLPPVKPVGQPDRPRPAPLFPVTPTTWVKLETGEDVRLSDLTKQQVYDQNNMSIGYVVDFASEKDAKEPSLMLSLSGAPVATGSKYVAVPATAFRISKDNGKFHVVWIANRDAVVKATPYTFDTAVRAWSPIGIAITPPQ
jgi:hypothetical protein